VLSHVVEVRRIGKNVNNVINRIQHVKSWIWTRWDAAETGNDETYDEAEVPTCLEIDLDESELLLMCFVLLFLLFVALYDDGDGRPLSTPGVKR